MADDPMDKSHDILVIGAGPAGSSAARTAALRGAKVLSIDQKRNLGSPIQCGELVSQWIFPFLPSFSRSIVQTIDKLITHIPNGGPFEMKSPGFMLDRSLFDRELATSAILSGAEISIGTKALDLTSEGVIIEKDGKRKLIQSKVVIGADGVDSIAARRCGQPQIERIFALQYEVVLFESQSHADIFFDKDYEGGYAWFFPKKRTANVGIGIVASKMSHLPELLDRFLNHLKESGKLPKIEIVSKTGGSIPCNPRLKSLFGNVLLVGDAAGHAHPITGAGILNAVVGGEIAGRVAAEAVLKGDMGYLKNYETQWEEAFGKTLTYGAMKRKFIEENWGRPEINFINLIRKTWVGFKEYYEERRRQSGLKFRRN